MNSFDENKNIEAENENGSFTNDNRDINIHSEDKYDNSADGKSYSYTNYRPPVNGSGYYGNVYRTPEKSEAPVADKAKKKEKNTVLKNTV